MNQALSRAGHIRTLNDAFRQAGPSGNAGDLWLLTPGVQALGLDRVMGAVAVVQRFDEFTQDNDPHGEHDFGAFELAGEQLFWKIDYIDRALTASSPDPTDPTAKRRVLTIHLSSEY